MPINDYKICLASRMKISHMNHIFVCLLQYRECE